MLTMNAGSSVPANVRVGLYVWWTLMYPSGLDRIVAISLFQRELVPDGSPPKINTP